jgi:predicted kinase
MAQDPPRTDGTSQLIVFAGTLGTGKTSLARAVARHLRAVYLDKDTIKECTLALAERMKLDQVQRLAGPLSYELLVDIARDNLSLGLSVVLDSPAGYQVFRERVKGLARSAKAELRLIECICTDERLLRQRVETRSQDLPAHRTRDWTAYQSDLAEFERLTERRLVVDTAESLSINLHKVLVYLGHS